ncbi:hypothetical protein [Photorhabdus akhurstii]|uniref:hypothetical protein n=1 Tax=Photorhabdus akhurstii TaxID=171438 RepID=UPI003703A773
MPEEKDFRDYILILPVPNMPPVYVYLSKPPVKPLEVGEYQDLAGRSRNDGLDIDHIPSQAALKIYLIERYGELDSCVLKNILENSVCIAVSRWARQKYSETYGGRNTPTKRIRDASDLKAAVDSNFDAMTPGLKEEGYTDSQLNNARKDLHKLNQEKGWYR